MIVTYDCQNMFIVQVTDQCTQSWTNCSQGILKGEVSCTIGLLLDWFGISCMTSDNFCFYLQNRLFQTSQTGGQWYSDTSPLQYSLLQLTGQTLGRVFNSRSGCISCHALTTQSTNMTQLRVENSAQTTFRFSPIRYCTPPPSV